MESEDEDEDPWVSARAKGSRHSRFRVVEEGHAPANLTRSSGSFVNHERNLKNLVGSDKK